MPAEAVNVEQFLAAVRASGLLTPAELIAALAAAGDADRTAAPALAAVLIRQKALTTFQARKLLAGISKGMVLGPYRILAPLGTGGMAKVYLARDIRSNNPVALKVLPPHWAREQERLLLRFRREMEMCKEMDHQHVARAYESGVAGDVHYIALEYVPGKTLFRTVATGGPLEPTVAARVFAEAADGLAHAHSKGLVHRDVKPSNLMITPAGHAKVLDLGLALRPGEDGDSEVIGGKGYVVGTMDYVSPEQSRNAAGVDFRTDLYSLGGTLFFALTGRPPFPGGTSIEKIKRQRKEMAPRVEEYNLDVPEGLADLVDELMAKDPAQRPPSAEAVKKRLRQWAAPALPPDVPGETTRILEAIASDPNPADDTPELAHVRERNPAWWVIIVGGALALSALLVLLAKVLK